MKRKITLLDLVDFRGIDEKDNEPIEGRWIIGYFLDEKIKNKALEIYEEKKEGNEEIQIKEFDFSCSPNQKYVYVLFFEYSVLIDDAEQDKNIDPDDQYTYYYYYFEPLSSYEKCLKLKEKLLEDDKYKVKDYMIYDSDDGFHIEKIKINEIRRHYI